MKYSKSLQQSLYELPTPLRENSISYKRWKKHCKTMLLDSDCELALKTLEEQCNYVDKHFKEQYNKIFNIPLYMIPFVQCGIITILTPIDVLKYAQMNSQTVYKVCKKLMKTFHSTIPIEWLTNIRASHKYLFMGSNNTTHIQVKLKGHVECPICLEDIKIENNKDPKLIVFGCGHYGCMDCVLHYAGVDDMKGTWFNLLANSRKKDCPVCRFETALDKSICIKQ